MKGHLHRQKIGEREQEVALGPEAVLQFAVRVYWGAGPS